MTYTELLKKSADKSGNIACMGLDPVLDKIPEGPGLPGERIYSFYENILNCAVKRKIYPSAVKPNYAFYAQYGIGGIETLKKIIDIYRREGIPVILDVKRGDIGSTAAAYAREAFDFFEADAVTLAPYMGYDSIGPFVDRKPEGGFYVLTKTSNQSSSEFQDLEVSGTPLYMKTAEKIIEWNRPGIGSVVGATYPEQLRKISSLFAGAGREIPLLIPGVGSQGGDIKEVMDILRDAGSVKIHRINSSSAINYAYLNSPGRDYAEAAIDELEKFNSQTGI